MLRPGAWNRQSAPYWVPARAALGRDDNRCQTASNLRPLYSQLSFLRKQEPSNHRPFEVSKTPEVRLPAGFSVPEVRSLALAKTSADCCLVIAGQAVDDNRCKTASNLRTLCSHLSFLRRQEPSNHNPFVVSNAPKVRRPASFSVPEVRAHALAKTSAGRRSVIPGRAGDVSLRGNVLPESQTREDTARSSSKMK